MSYTIIRPKNRKEWLAIRNGGIGSSEVGTILGLNPWETPYQLWRRKIGLDPAKEQTFAMRAGHYLEDAVSLFFQDETGLEVIKASKGDWIIRNNERPFMQVSPDRTFWLGESRANTAKGILECKTTQMEVDADNVPMTWFSQLQYQLHVAGLDHGAIAWLTQGRAFGFREYTRDEDFCRYIEEEVTRFWVDNIVGKQEPPILPGNDTVLRWPQAEEGKTITADSELIDMCRELKELRETLSALDTRKKELQNIITNAMGDAEALVTPAVGFERPQIVATWKTTKPTARFDEKRFAQDMPETFAKYQHQQPGSRRLILK